jgi:hypothetical protein
MICENCGNEIRENRKHIQGNSGELCLIMETDTKRAVGWGRRKPAKNLYKK